MSKLIIIPNSLDMIHQNINNIDGCILGIKDLSVNMPVYFAIDEIKSIVKFLKHSNKEVFISLNKNMHNSDITYLKETLIKLDNLDVTGILFYDISIVNLKNKLKLKIDLVWDQEHLTTNSVTANYWNNFGAPYTHLSSEITLEEILTIKKETTSKLMVTVFGFIPVFTSKRNLVKNYLKTFNIDSNDNINYISKENKTYIVVDDKLGTTVYSNYILNGIYEYETLNKHNIDYIILNSFETDEISFQNVINIYSNLTPSNTEESNTKLNELFNNLDSGFMHIETVYRVKKND